MLQAAVNKTLSTGNRMLFEQKVNPFKRRDTFRMTSTASESILDIIVAANKIRSKNDQTLSAEMHCEACGGEEDYENTDGDVFEHFEGEVFPTGVFDNVEEPNMSACGDDDNNSAVDDLDDKFQREEVAQIEMNEFGMGDLLKDSCDDEGRVLSLKFPKVCIMVRFFH
jgi:hypothetical protein